MTARYGSKFSVYISKDILKSPNQFFYDIYIAEVVPGMPFTLTRDFVNSNNFTIAIYVQGYNQFVGIANRQTINVVRSVKEKRLPFTNLVSENVEMSSSISNMD